jgi:hypothetical protein
VRTFGILLFTLILSGFSALPCGAAVYHSNGSVSHVQALHNYYAHDGDTITLPPGRFSWTRRLEITKGITLQGETTVTGAGTSNPRITDATIIKDDTPRSGRATGIITARMTPTKSFRLTGVTFAPGISRQRATGIAFIQLSSKGATPNMSMRIDHCHFASLYQGRLISTSGWVYGVADHNVMKVTGHCVPFLVLHGAYGGANQINGNGSWADYPWYGTEKFFFIEDNTIIRSNFVVANSLVDCLHGGRWVTRHNYLQDVIPGGHGTEGGVIRGQRVNEFYNNTVRMTVGWSGVQRSGTSMWHDNTFTGVASQNDRLCNLANYRQTSTRANPIWGFSDGTSPWDVNDTEGNGTYVEGRPPFLFASGSATRGTITLGPRAMFSDSTKNWTPNQWVGCSIKNTNPASASYRLGSYIIFNTSNTIAYAYNSATNGGHLLFRPGDTYEIHRVLVTMDQNGRGKGDQVVGTPYPINFRTRTPWWTHQALEPCFSWNNVHTSTGHIYGFRSGSPTLKANRDYYNLGGGFPASSTPSAVSSTYTAALNGVDYVGTFVYPHPLTALPIGAARAVVTDFSGEGSPDYVLQRASSQQTGIMYLDNNVSAGSALGPTSPAGWKVVAAADFNGGGKPDYLLYNRKTRQTGIYYLNNNVYIGSGYGPTLPPGWELVAAADFNGDGKADYLLYNVNTQQTAIYYLNNNVYIGSALGPTVSGWSLFGP